MDAAADGYVFGEDVYDTVEAMTARLRFLRTWIDEATGGEGRIRRGNLSDPHIRMVYRAQCELRRMTGELNCLTTQRKHNCN